MSFVQRRRFLWTLFIIGLILLAAVAGHSTTLARVGFDELAHQATAIARVRCLSSTTLWRNGEIWTETEFEVLEQNKGTLPGIFRISLPGGKLAHLQSRVDGVPAFLSGEEAYLFLWKTNSGENSVLGWTQGTFRIVRDPQTRLERVTQDSSSMPLFDLATHKFRHGGVRNLPLPIFQLKLKRALEIERQ